MLELWQVERQIYIHPKTVSLHDTEGSTVVTTAHKTYSERPEATFGQNILESVEVTNLKIKIKIV